MLQQRNPLFTPAGELVLRYIFGGAVIALVAIIGISLKKRRDRENSERGKAPSEG